MARKVLPVICAVTAVAVVAAFGAALGRAAPAGGVPSAGATGSMTVTEPGTVVDGRHVKGSINIRADNVTVRRSTVIYGGFHAVRVFAGVRGTVLEDVAIHCTNRRTNGLVFGHYTARRVTVTGCRNAFAYSASAPALITGSTVDGHAFSPGAVPPTSPPASPATSRPASASSRSPAPRRDASPLPSAPPSAAASAARTPAVQSGTAGPTTAVPRPPAVPAPAPTPAPASNYPNESTTGVPRGVQLTPTGSLTITKRGAVVDARLVRGTIVVKADDVTIRRTKIENTGAYPIRLASGYRRLLVEDTEIDGRGIASVAILYGNYILRRVNIHSVKDGPRIEGPDVLIEDSYVHHLTRVKGGHHDAIQIRQGRNIVIRGNNLQAYNASTRDPMNAVIQVGSLSGPLDGLLIEGNLLNGGNYTVAAGGPRVRGFACRGNAFQRQYRYGVATGIDEHDEWRDNRWHDNGQIIPRPGA